MVLEARRIYWNVFKIQLCHELPLGMGGESSITVQGFGQKASTPQASDLPQSQGPCYPQYTETDTFQI